MCCPRGERVSELIQGEGKRLLRRSSHGGRARASRALCHVDYITPNPHHHHLRRQGHHHGHTAMKRSRASPSPTPSLSPPPSPSHKLVRHSPGPPDRALTCSLPPTCSSSPVQFDTLEALESHHSKCHAWICGSQGCGKVFPDGRLMELVRVIPSLRSSSASVSLPLTFSVCEQHQIENHDPVASVKQSQGQPIVSHPAILPFQPPLSLITD